VAAKKKMKSAAAETDSRVGRTRPSAATSDRLSQAGTPSWALQMSWSLLLAAIVVTPLLMTNLSWLTEARSVWLHSGTPMFKALVMQMLIGTSFACFSYSLFTHEVAIRWHRVGWLALAFVVWSAITVATSVSPATALIGYYANAEGLMALIVYGTAAFLTLQLADTPLRIRQLLQTSSLTAAVVAAYGLIQTARLDPIKWPIGLWGAFRSFSTVGNPDMFGAFMVLNLFVLAALLLSETDKRWRTIYAVATLLVGLAAFTSLARAAWLGAIAGAIVFAILAVHLKPRVTRAEIILVGVLILAVVGAGAISLVNTDVDANVARRLTAAFNPQDKNTLGRTETWRIAAIAIGKRPIVGYGPDTFGLAFQPNKTQAFASLVEPNIVQANAHSTVIQIALERGVPGLVIWVALLGLAAVLALPVIWRGDERSLAARVLLAGVFASIAGYFVASLLTPTSHESSLYLWCMLAILLSPVASKVDRPVPRVVAVVCIATGLLGAAIAFPLLLADARAAIADDEAVAPSARIEAADAATHLNPLSAEYAAVAAKAYAQALPVGSSGRTATEFFSKAYSQMNRSVSLESADPHRRSTLVGLLLIGGEKLDASYFKEAVDVAATAVRGAPNDLEAQYWYARALYADGRPAEAIPLLERALRVRPQYGDAALMLSDLYVGRGDKAAARALLERTIPLVEEPQVLKTRLQRLGTGVSRP
jgi:O-antigen ligase